MNNQPENQCAFCDGNAQYIDSQSGQAVCLEHSRLEVAAPGHSARRLDHYPHLIIRPAVPEDRAIIHKLALYFWGETEMDCFGRTYKMLKLPSFLLCEEDAVVGCLTYSMDAEEVLTIVMLNILPGYNGYGGGRMLIDHAEAIARERGIERLRVATSNDNLLALYFYQRLGFVIVGIEVNAIHENVIGFAGIPVHDEIRLERNLIFLARVQD